MPAVETKLNGYFPADYTQSERLVIPLIEIGRFTAPGPATIRDARPLQAQAASEAEFFDKHGFVLLNHETAVTDWDTEPGVPPPESRLAQAYFPEIDALIRERLYPGRRLHVNQYSTPLRRGHGTATPMYGSGIHQDFALTPDDFQASLSAFATDEIGQRWRGAFDQASVEGFAMIDFWRTTNMEGPLKHMPLALCDPNTVDRADLVPTGFLGLTATGRPTTQLSLRYNPGQAWYWYPDMRPDEVLVFKLFEYFKADGDEPPLRTCFHSAFEDPGAPADAPQRQSCEHRVSVSYLREPPPQ